MSEQQKSFIDEEEEQIPYELEEVPSDEKSKWPPKYKDVIQKDYQLFRNESIFTEKIDFVDALFLALKKKEISEEKLLEVTEMKGTPKKDLLDMQEFEYYKYLYNFYLKTPLENLITAHKNRRTDPKGGRKALDKFHNALITTNEFDLSSGSGLSPIISYDGDFLHFNCMARNNAIGMLKIRKMFESSEYKVVRYFTNSITLSLVGCVVPREAENLFLKKEKLIEFAKSEGVLEEAKSIRDITDKKTLFEIQESEYYKYIYDSHIKEPFEKLLSALKADWSRSYGRNIYDAEEKFRLVCFDTKEFTEHVEMYLDHRNKRINFKVVNNMKTNDIHKLRHIFKHSGCTLIEPYSDRLTLKVK